MANYRVTCITKPQNGSHEHITHIGNSLDRWKLATAEVVRRIDSKADTFYVQDSRTGNVAYIGVVRPSNHAPYLRTYANGNWNDNLLSLAQC